MILISILKVLMIVATVICSFLLIAVILLQKAKGEGLGLAFGAQMGESLFGARASNVLVRITIWLGVIFLVSTTVLAKIYSQGSGHSLMGRVAPVGRAPMPVQPGVPMPAPLPVAAPTAPAAAPSEAVQPAPAAPAAEETAGE